MTAEDHVDDGEADTEMDLDMEGPDSEFPALDGWEFINSDSDAENDLEGAAGETAKQRPEFQELQSLGLTEKPVGGSIGVHMRANMWRSRAGTGPMYGRSWGIQSERSPKQALVRCLLLMWGTHCDCNPDDKLAHKYMVRLKKIWDADPGKP